jgi:bla regulator protein BlaR1
MDFNLISQPYFQKLVRAVCLTLLHSVWQGLVVAVLVGGILLLTRKQRPAVRYNLLCGALMLFLCAAGLTFYLEMQTESGVFSTLGASSEVADRFFVQDRSAPGHFGETVGWKDLITDFCNQNAGAIVAIWFLIFGMKSARAITGMVYLRKIRRDIYEPDISWKHRFMSLAAKLQVSDQIALMESHHVKVPMVMGYLKPMVLVPLGMLANLPAAQVEAILLHELAHIRRRDYVVNLMQIFCENVFFFHPAVLWISFLIREEREHCCDDLAISVMQNKTSFIHALVSFQEYNQSTPAFGMAFSKKRNHLLDRIRRITNNNNKSLDAMEKLFVTVSLVAVAALSAAVSHVEPVRKNFNPVKTKVLPGITIVAEPPSRTVEMVDTLPKKKAEAKTVIHSANVYSAEEGVSTYNVTTNGKQYNIIRKNGKVTDLAIDGKEIPENQIASYQTEIDAILKEVQVAHERAEVDRQKAEEHREQANIQRQQAELQRQQAEQIRIQANNQRVQADKLRAEADLGREQAEKGRIDADRMRTDADKMRIDADRYRVMAEKNRENAEVARKRAEEFRYTADKDREEYEQMQNGLIDDLIETGTIKGISNLSYKLSRDELIVNGKQQSDELHKKLKNKYIKDKAVEMVYNFKGRTGYTTTGFIYTR